MTTTTNDTPSADETAARARLGQALRRQAQLANAWSPARDAEYQTAVADVATAEAALAALRTQEMTR